MIRFFDILIATIAMLVVFPLLFVSMLLMMLFQGFPIVFFQTRKGKNFQPFIMYKLRTMKLDTEDELALTKGMNDERITKLGGFLRKYKIDELPQFINILKGEMSIVGSRPQIPFYTEKFKNRYRKILMEKPGLLSIAAIKYSNEEELLAQVENPIKHYEQVLLPKKCEMDIKLVENFNLKSYFSVILYYLKKRLSL